MIDLQARLREALLRLEELKHKLGQLEAIAGRLEQTLNLIRQNPAS